MFWDGQSKLLISHINTRASERPLCGLCAPNTLFGLLTCPHSEPDLDVSAFLVRLGCSLIPWLDSCVTNDEFRFLWIVVEVELPPKFCLHRFTWFRFKINSDINICSSFVQRILWLHNWWIHGLALYCYIVTNWRALLSGSDQPVRNLGRRLIWCMSGG